MSGDFRKSDSDYPTRVANKRAATHRAVLVVSAVALIVIASALAWMTVARRAPMAVRQRKRRPA